MLFTSIHFICFFCALMIGYYLFPKKYKWGLMLIASLIFYMSWHPIHILILFIVAIISYLSGVYFYADKNNLRRKIVLSISVISCFSFLFIYKYLNFFSDLIYKCLDMLHIAHEITAYDLMMPVGISFFTFKAVSYIIDVYRGEIAEKNFFKVLLYIAFFPQLASGPIERSKALIPQFVQDHPFCPQMVESGACLMLIGYFKKMVVSDNLSAIISKAFNYPEKYSGLILLLVACMYSIQIYCDFSGYSDIAIGCARAFGYNTKSNFLNPYFSKSISEFWRRWHISLSSWFKDYLYIPLGGNRKGTVRKYLNVMIVFLASGLWHGASWNFVFWGLLHGGYQLIGGVTLNFRNKIYSSCHIEKYQKIRSFFAVLTTFLLVTFAWIFFRADTINDGYRYVVRILSAEGIHMNLLGIISQIKLLVGTKTALFSAVIAISSFMIFEFLDYKENVCLRIQRLGLCKKIICYSMIIVFILLFASAGISDFIYVRF